jgi:hypothetical protein
LKLPTKARQLQRKRLNYELLIPAKPGIDLFHREINMRDFLGPYGKATIILFDGGFGNELPKIGDLKKFLKITEGRYYKRYGPYRYSIEPLSDLIDIIREHRSGNKNKHAASVSDYLFTAPNVEPNIFLALKYSNSIIEGFNLTTAAMTELEELLRIYSAAISIHESPQDIVSMLERNQDRKLAGKKDDVTVLKPDLDGIKRLLEGYGSQNLAASVKQLEDWYETYRWKQSKTSATTPETTNAEVIEEVI